jgi:pantoate--beta-alanine ligase
MRVVETVFELRRIRKAMTGIVGLVPTMGALHEGHLELVRRSRADCDAVVASVFVNPTQFGPGEDLHRYPRDFAGDRTLLEATGVDLLFAPSQEEIYPAGFDTWVVPGRHAERLEGTARPGHFRGVCTVVAKLFHLVEPNRAYFGRKDAQQLAVIRRMTAELAMNVEIVAVPTVREADGLAMSSRNAYLGPEERVAARVLHRSLRRAEGLWRAGERDAEVLRAAMRQTLSAEPRASIDYVSVADDVTLEELSRIDRPALVSLAVWIGSTRLIDNVGLEDKEDRRGRRTGG